MNDQDYAIVIGINNYAGLPRLKLKAAEYDALKFKRWLQSPEGGAVPKQNIYFLLSRFYAPSPNTIRSQPMKADIDEALVNLQVDQDQRVGRRFYFYFAGHGIGPSLNEVALLMANATRRTLGQNMGIRDYLDFFIKWAPFDEIVLFLDCCRDIEESFAAMPCIFTKDLRDGAPPVNRMIALGARYGHKSWEAQLDPNDWRPRSLFTTALLEGLQTAVDDSGNVTGDSLGIYLKERVPILAKQSHRRQSPEVLGESQREIIFATPRQIPLVQIPIPPDWRGTVVLRENQREVDRFTAAPGNPPWEIPLPMGIYILENESEIRYINVEPGKKEATYVQLTGA